MSAVVVLLCVFFVPVPLFDEFYYFIYNYLHCFDPGQRSRRFVGANNNAKVER
jgi:hypothetical protein